MRTRSPSRAATSSSLTPPGRTPRRRRLGHARHAFLYGIEPEYYDPHPEPPPATSTSCSSVTATPPSNASGTRGSHASPPWPTAGTSSSAPARSAASTSPSCAGPRSPSTGPFRNPDERDAIAAAGRAADADRADRAWDQILAVVQENHELLAPRATGRVAKPPRPNFRGRVWASLGESDLTTDPISSPGPCRPPRPHRYAPPGRSTCSASPSPATGSQPGRSNRRPFRRSRPRSDRPSRPTPPTRPPAADTRVAPRRPPEPWFVRRHRTAARLAVHDREE